NLVLIIRDQGGKSELTTVINHGGSVVAAYAKTLGNEYYGVEALKAFSASTGSIIRLWCSSEEL
ncbi:MAG: hypothetical protein QXS73_04140, partial [Desulfurococcaceae archaeon]